MKGKTLGINEKLQENEGTRQQEQELKVREEAEV